MNDERDSVIFERAKRRAAYLADYTAWQRRMASFTARERLQDLIRTEREARRAW